MESLNRLREALKKAISRRAAKHLDDSISVYVKKGKIFYEEIDCDEETKRSLLLLAYRESCYSQLKHPRHPCS